MDSATQLALGYGASKTINQDYTVVIVVCGPNGSPSAIGTATQLINAYAGDSNYNFRIAVWKDAKSGTAFRGGSWTLIIGIK